MPKRKRFRSDIAYGLEKPESAVDREEGVISGYAVMSKGEVRGHGMEADDTTIDQVVELGNAAKSGIKTRFGHPNMSQTAFGTYLGRSVNFRRDGDVARADLHLSDSAEYSPNGNLSEYTFQMAEEEPDMFGASIVFSGDPVKRLNEDGTVQKDDNGNELPPVTRLEKLYAADVVDDPAANSGMFSSTAQLSAEMTERLDELLESEDAIEACRSFLRRYRNLRGHNKRVDRIAAKLENALSLMDDSQPEEAPMGKPNTDPQAPETDGALKAAHDRETEEARKQAAEEATQAERKRQTEIRTSCRSLKLPEEFADGLIEKGLSIEDARKEIIEKHAAELQPAPVGGPSVLQDNRDKMLEGIETAIDCKFDLGVTPEKRKANRGNEFRGIGLQSLARVTLEAVGVQGISRMSAEELYHEVIRLEASSQGTGDFTNILSNTANKALLTGWEEAPPSYTRWTKQKSLSDFKTADLVATSAYAGIAKVPEGDAPKMGTFRDNKEQAKLETYGGKYVLTRQSMINDDLSQFAVIPRAMTGALRQNINNDVYNYVWGTDGVGPTMLEDDVAMFNAASHNNLVAIGSGGAPTKSAFGVGWIAMVTQQVLKGDENETQRRHMANRPRYILHGPNTAQVIYELTQSAFYAASGDDGSNSGTQLANMYGPGASRSLEPIEEPLLDYLITDTATYPWYLAADSNLVGTIGVFTLNGADAPRSSSRPSMVGEAEGMHWQVMMDYDIAAEDWRGMYCNTGR